MSIKVSGLISKKENQHKKQDEKNFTQGRKLIKSDKKLQKTKNEKEVT